MRAELDIGGPDKRVGSTGADLAAEQIQQAVSLLENARQNLPRTLAHVRKPLTQAIRLAAGQLTVIAAPSRAKGEVDLDAHVDG